MWNMYWFPRAYNEEGNNLETLEVFVDHVIYRNESNGYCVLSADYEEEELIVTGIFRVMCRGQCCGLPERWNIMPIMANSLRCSNTRSLSRQMRKASAVIWEVVPLKESVSLWQAGS